MKKLISLLLVLTLALSLVGGAAISAFASDELEETAADETVVIDGEQGEPAAEADETAEETDDADDASASDELDELVAVTDGDGDGIEADGPAAAIDGDPPAPPSSSSAYKKASGLVAGQYYIIGSRPNPESPYSILAVSGQNVIVTTLAKLDDATDDMLWQASAASASSLTVKSGGVSLYYLESASGRTTTIGTFATASGNANWSYGDGKLVYTAGGQNAGEYAVSISGGAITAEKDGAGTINIYTDGSDLGTSTSGGEIGGGGSGGESGSSSGTEYAKARELKAGYVVLSIGDGHIATSFDMQNPIYKAVSPANDKVTAEKGNFLEVIAQGGGFAMFALDPPDGGEKDRQYLCVVGGAVTYKNGGAPSGYWTYERGTLSYVDGGTTWVVTGASTSGITAAVGGTPAMVDIFCGDSKPAGGGPPPGDSGEKVDADAPVISAQPTAVKYVIEDSGYPAPSYSVTATLPEGSAATDIDFQWYVNGEKAGTAATVAVDGDKKASSSYTASELAGKTSGVYPVYVEASVTLVTPADNTTDPPTEEKSEIHTVKSYVVNFIVCKGVKENTILTFSDVHEKWDNVGVAVKDTIITTGGFIPALVIATGDYNNSYVAGWSEELIEKCITTMIDRIALQLAGIDTVWVSGNHDNGYATGFTNANKQAGLGMVDADYYDKDNGISGTGIIYDSRSDDWSANKGTSEKDAGLIVIGVNYEDLGSQGAYSNPSTGRPSDPSKLNYGTEGSTGTVYEHLKTALDSIVADDNYNGELIVISTHAGLHTVGVDPDSKAAGAKEWSGGNDYSVTNSAAVVKLINSYVDEYGLDIMFLFGHDHSKGEKEFIKTPGDTIVSTVSYADRTTEEIVLKFTYGHSGYVGTHAGGTQTYSYIEWDDENISRYANLADGNQTKNESLTRAGDNAISRAHASVWQYEFAPATIEEVFERMKEAGATPPEPGTKAYDDLAAVIKAQNESMNQFKEAMIAAFKDKLPKGASEPTFYDVEGYLPDYDYADDELIAKGITFTLPYPEGTGKNDTFIVYHLHAEHDPATGDTTYSLLETLQGDDLFLEENGITLTTTSLSPFAVVKVGAPSNGGGNAPGGNRPGAPKTGDKTNIALWAVILTLCAGGTAAALLPRRKRNHN